MPEEPPNDYQTYAVTNTFYLANRSRSYLSGMAVMPLPLGVDNVSQVLSAHPVLIEREILDSCVFAIDDLYLEEQNKLAREEKPETE